MPATYRVTVVTGTPAGAGTDANVYATLFGSLGNSGERLLDNAADNFENGTTDVFSIEMRDIGAVNTVRIRHDNGGLRPGWFLDRVTVHREDTDEEWTFPCNRWLARDEDDGQIDRLLDQS
jgi:PLAT/LH2 domain